MIYGNNETTESYKTVCRKAQKERASKTGADYVASRILKDIIRKPTGAD